MNNAQQQPPRFGIFLLKLVCRQEYMDEVRGDLEETYAWRLQSKGAISANWNFYKDVFSAIRFMQLFKAINGSGISQGMIGSFVKSSFRNFKRHWSYTFLNVFGLAIGMMAALFILEYVSDELNYNTSKAADSIYRVSNDYYRFDKMVYESSLTFSGVGPAMQKDIPQVTDFVRLFSPGVDWGSATILTKSEDPSIKFKEHKLFFSDPEVLSFFDLKIIQGQNDLSKPNTILLTRGLAEKYFGAAESAIGKTLRYNDDLWSQELLVTGIFEKPNFNLQVDLEALVSYSTVQLKSPDQFENDWGGNSFITYVKVNQGASIAGIEDQMSDITLRYKPGYAEKNDQGEYNRVNRYFLTPIKDIHLNSQFQNEVGPVGDARTIFLLQAIALFIVAIAWINFINLTTAKSVSRAREVGVRKVMGAKKNELVTQFFTEALLINLFAVILAVLFVFLGQSVFNEFVRKELLISDIDILKFGIPALCIFLIGTFLSGVYPAMSLSSHKVVLALKGKTNSSSSPVLRRGLIIFQLMFSSLLIIVTMAINEQMSYMNNQDLGFQKEKVLIVKGATVKHTDQDVRLLNIKLFKDRLRNMPTVGNVGTTTIIPGRGILRGIIISPERESEDLMRSIERVVVDANYLSTIGVDFIAGGDFDPDASVSQIVLNASAAKELGFDDPIAAIGQPVYEFGQEERRIAGIFSDYHHESLNRKKDPMYFVRIDAFDSFYAIKLSGESVAASVAEIESIFADVFPGNPADYYFLDQFFDKQYQRDEVNNKVFTAFATMAIIVACLGLYGLSSFTAVQKTKEIGVRKVLGAKVKSIFFLLSKEVVLLSLLGFVLAVPIAFYGLSNWLSSFAYHIEINLFMFILPLFMVLIITLIAVSQKIIKSAISNPVDSLRNE